MMAFFEENSYQLLDVRQGTKYTSAMIKSNGKSEETRQHKMSDIWSIDLILRSSFLSLNRRFWVSHKQLESCDNNIAI